MSKQKDPLQVGKSGLIRQSEKGVINVKGYNQLDGLVELLKEQLQNGNPRPVKLTVHMAHTETNHPERPYVNLMATFEFASSTGLAVQKFAAVYPVAMPVHYRCNSVQRMRTDFENFFDAYPDVHCEFVFRV